MFVLLAARYAALTTTSPHARRFGQTRRAPRRESTMSPRSLPIQPRTAHQAHDLLPSPDEPPRQEKADARDCSRTLWATPGGPARRRWRRRRRPPPLDASSSSAWLTSASRRLGEPRRQQGGSSGRLLFSCERERRQGCEGSRLPLLVLGKVRAGWLGGRGGLLLARRTPWATWFRARRGLAARRTGERGRLRAPSRQRLRCSRRGRG